MGGTGTVTLNNINDNFGVRGLEVPSAGDTLTVAPGVTIQGSSGVVGSSGGGLISNEGTIEGDGGGTLTVQGYTNFAGGTLTVGTWGAVGNSTLRLVGANITTNAANILLDGAASQIYSGTSGTTNALAGFVTNAATGSFTVQNGADFTSAAAFSNAGTLTINGGGTFIPGGTGAYTQTGGTTILDGGTLGTSGNQINIQGGTLSGPGTVNADLTNAGEVDLGSNPGILTVTGNYMQTAAGALAYQGRRRHGRQPVRSGQYRRHGFSGRHFECHAHQRLCARSRRILRRVEFRQFKRQLRDLQFAANQQ